MLEETVDEGCNHIGGGMGSAPDDGAALSDFEDDDLEAAPVVLPASSGGESLKAALAELEAERHARKAAEVAKADVDSSFARLKALTQEAVRQREEALRLKEEALRGKEDVNRQLEHVLQQKEQISRQRDEAVKQRDESLRQKEELGKARDAARAEIEGTARLLISGAEKVTSMVSGVKSFGGGLPSSKYSGLAAIAFGFGKRMEEVVEELLRQRDGAINSRHETQERMEQRNYSIAIEVSQLEASITRLTEDVGRKSSELERLQKSVVGKDRRLIELEDDVTEKVGLVAKEAALFRKRGEDAEAKIKSLTSDLNMQKDMLSEQWKYVLSVKQGLLGLQEDSPLDSETQMPSSAAEVDTAGDERLPQQCLEGVKLVADLVTSLGIRWKKNQENWVIEKEELVRRLERLAGQKQDAAELLAVALTEKQQVLESISNLRVEVSQRQSDVDRLQAALREAQTVQRDVLGTSAVGNEQTVSDIEEKNADLARIRAELTLSEETKSKAVSKVSALEGELSKLRQHIGELEGVLVRAREDSGELRSLVGMHANELATKKAQIQEFHMKVEGLTAEVEAAEEEVARWKQAATEEAAAGAALLEDVQKCNDEIAALRQQIVGLRSSLEEANLKLRSKEEMATAAITARHAAERSLQMADERATELRERVEELNKQLEDSENKRENKGSTGRVSIETCWPWLLGRRPTDSTRSRGGNHMAAEMEELLEPLV